MKTIYISLLLLVSVFLIVPTHVSAAEISLKDQVLSIPNWSQLLEKINLIADKIVEKTKGNEELQTKIRTKITKVLSLYWEKTDTKSQKIVIIFSYLQSQIDGQIKVASSRVLQRLERIEVEKYKKLSSSRVNKLKKKRYERIPIKK